MYAGHKYAMPDLNVIKHKFTHKLLNFEYAIIWTINDSWINNRFVFFFTNHLHANEDTNPISYIVTIIRNYIFIKYHVIFLLI